MKGEGVMMKKAVRLVLFPALPFAASAKAQNRVRIGWKAGYSLATQYGISPGRRHICGRHSEPESAAGGVFVEFPITESVGIQQEFIYAMKGSRQNGYITTPVDISTVSKYELNYFESLSITISHRFVARWTSRSTAPSASPCRSC
ncbi:MAG: PorT family protein [Comamonadaceae bacterium]|nr:PorT family protein [Comamonadaceae bacterium]